MSVAPSASPTWLALRSLLWAALLPGLFAGHVPWPSRALFIYWVIWFAAVHVFVMGYEELPLRNQFGPSCDAYTRAVGRWIPGRRRRAQHPPESS